MSVVDRVHCPRCGAALGERCTVLHGPREGQDFVNLGQVHRERYSAWCEELAALHKPDSAEGSDGK